MSSFLFLHPWLLSALIALPALWFLLRIMPPAPKRIFLPSARFLEGLVPKTQTPSKTPWWILLLRMMIVALVITALAQPVLNPSQQYTNNNAIRLVVENGWSSADLWETKIRTAEDILAQAKRNNVSVYLNTTAREDNGEAPLSLGPFSADEALSRLKGFSPKPWISDFKPLKTDSEEAFDTLILSDGIHSKGIDTFVTEVKKHGNVRVITPKNENLPLVLARGKDQDGKFGFRVYAPEGIPPGTPITLQAMGESGQILSIENVILESSKTDIALQVPEPLRGDLSSVKILERNGAGSIYLFDGNFQNKLVGLAAPSQETEAKPFIEASFYLTRALEPYANLQSGSLDALLSTNPSMIILPDIAAFSTAQLSQLEKWVRDGGLLLRFAGPAMEQARQHFLTPTPLRKGARSLDGALRWEEPPKLETFIEGTPLSDIDIGEDIIIKQQILAEPTQDLPDKIWAQLDDGTPLVTAASMDAGMIVMVHTTASPDWSNLPLSGVFVQMLSRLVGIAGTPPENLQAINGNLEPIRVMDGYGRLVKPHVNTQMIAAKDFETTAISAAHPPGLYGTGDTQRALNLGDRISRIQALPDLGVTRSSYDLDYETNLMPHLLLAALLLLLLDWGVMIALSGHFRMRKFARVATVLLMIGWAYPAQAQVPDAYRYADGLYLGFIKSNDTSVNARTRRGLEALKEELTLRTSAEPDGVVGLDPARDILSFFPLIYWPIDARDQRLSDEAIRNVQGYLDQGGTILFDTREETPGANQAALAQITDGLNIPALAPIKDDHVLGRSFYLLDVFPGRYMNAEIWAESNSANGRDGVSSVLIGSHDWAGAWAQSSGRNYRSGASARQRELAMRFGVNLMMYALTGNYKADQVHVKHILERLGQ